MDLSKSFEPKKIEEFWSKEWEKRGYFSAKKIPGKPSFSIQLPPPNVTGTLHMGHAFNQTIMDGLVRYYRMKGYNTAWIPGTDHAGIATQIVVERQLESKNIDKNNLSREEFLKKVWEWKNHSGSQITRQMRRMGTSTDWSKEYFTMDEKMSKAVIDVFIKLYEDGLIYKGKKLVNWDPKLKTAVSDLEVISEEEEGKMYYIRYPLSDKSDSIIIATTRPETLLGDVAVAVNPDDIRYSKYIGKQLDLPLTDRKIPVISDSYVDGSFGTGCVKITPAHDFNDYDVGQRHNLSPINIFTNDAKINENCPKQYIGLERYEAREKIIRDLKNLKLLENIKPHKMIIPKGDRSGAVIEPMLTDQWFIAMSKQTHKNELFAGKSIAEVAIEKVAKGEIKFIPENWTNTYNQWLGNIQDWCISRQLWWGHQIPAWYDEFGNIFVAKNKEEAESKALATGNKSQLYQDKDVLDTWFSSALVPFSSLGWPNKTNDLKFFFPSSTLITGFDIIFFWVARMIMMSTYFTGLVPFKTVYVHGLIRDAQGQKMSKSKGNTLDPIDIIDGIEASELVVKRLKGLMNPKEAKQIEFKTFSEFPRGISAYGTDALRFTMASYASLGRNINFDLNRCEGYKNFCNKLWNATRFVLMNTDTEIFSEIDKNFSKESFSKADKWINSILQKTIIETEKGFKNYRFDNIASAIYKFIWDEYCDWYLEIAKVQLKGTNSQQIATQKTLLEVLEKILRVAHPIIPFITEQLWQKVSKNLNFKLNSNNSSIMIQEYPNYESNKINSDSEIWMIQLKDIINSCRNLRGEMSISPALKLPLFIECDSQEEIISFIPYIKSLAKLSEIHIVKKLPNSLAPVSIINNKKLMLKIEVDLLSEKDRLNKEIQKINIEITKSNLKLENQNFLSKAPSSIVTKEKNRLEKFSENLNKIKEQLAKLN